MMDKSTPFTLFMALIFVAAAHMIYYYPLLPDRVASHFDASGEADGWMSKDGFMIVYTILIVALAGVFMGIGVFLKRLPDSMINMSHKAYWLAPERRAQTLSTMSTLIFWYGCATLLFIISMMHLMFRINLGNEHSLGWSFWLLLAAFLILTGVWVTHLIRRFGTIPPYAKP